MDAVRAFFGICVIVALVLVPIVLYLLPAFVAMGRHHPNAAPIFIINLFAGWTGLVWVICLAWSFSAVPVAPAPVLVRVPVREVQAEEEEEDDALAIARQSRALEAQRAKALSQVKTRDARIARQDARDKACLARGIARDKAYRARGIEPGPLAWYHALSDLSQAAVLGLVFAVPAVVVVVLVAWHWT